MQRKAASEEGRTNKAISNELDLIEQDQIKHNGTKLSLSDMEVSAIEQDSFGQNGLVQYTSEQSGPRRNIPVTDGINKPGLDMEHGSSARGEARQGSIANRDIEPNGAKLFDVEQDGTKNVEVELGKTYKQ
jgi:hypothetical protein